MEMPLHLAGLLRDRPVQTLGLGLYKGSLGLPWWHSGKEYTCQKKKKKDKRKLKTTKKDISASAEAARDVSSILGSGRSLGGGNDNPLQ